MKIMHILFGEVEFGTGGEYRKFQYRFTCAILLFSTFITGIFQFSAWLGAAAADPLYVNISRAYLVLSLIYYFLIRRNHRLMPFISWSYAIISTFLHLSTLLLNTPDELRIIWFVLNLPAIYLILGPVVGIGFTVISAIAVIVANDFLAIPYTASAIITCLMGMAYLSIFFHAFTARSISFHHAMVESNRKLAEMASKDPLTSLLNARAYYALCEQGLLQARRTGLGFSMLFIDLDHFKSINDRFGHEAGDLVLKAVAGCLRDSLRESDVVGRIGGEEFSVFLPDTSAEGAVRLAEKLRFDIENLKPDIGPQRLAITASIGVAPGHPHFVTITDVQKQADEAMYEAKKAGRNRVTCFEGQ